MAIVIGIDGGGTKTRGLMADETGRIYSYVTAGPSNPNAVSKEQLTKTIFHIFEQIKSEAPNEFNRVQVCYFGMAGIGEGKIKNALHEVTELVCEKFGLTYEINNDGLNALFAGTMGEPGMVLISGTGSIAYGYSKTENFYRVGGWGYLFDDLGSGYDLGKEALMAVLQAYDGRGEQTALTNLLLNYFKVDDVPSIVPVVFQSEQPRSTIAPLSQIVMKAYDNNDTVSQRLVEKMAFELSRIIKAMQKKLESDQTSYPVHLSGGMFSRTDVFIPLLKKHFNRNVQFIKLEHEPVVGAVVAALKSINIKVTDSFRTETKVL